MLPPKTSWTIGILVLLLVGLPYLPGQKRFIGLELNQFGAMLRLRAPESKPAVAKVPVITPPEASSKPAVNKVAQVDYLDVPPGSLDGFFAALRRTQLKEPGSVTRILHYGDSPTTADLITSDVRRLFQQQFGDAGHGFLLIAPPWAWYGHQGMQVHAKGWKTEPASLSRARDGIHGLGGVSFRGSAGAVSTVRFPEGHTHGVLYYLEQPEGGKVTVTAAGSALAEFDTNGQEKIPRFADFAIPADAKELELRVTSGQVRLFGYRFDKPGPGVEYSSLGVNGAQVQMVVRYFEQGQWTAALQHEKPDLVVVNYGTNESLYPEYLDKDYPKELRIVIDRIRAAVPQASVLIMSPMDRGIVSASGDINTSPALVHLVEIQKKVAAETGCAFFNTFEAMGGAGTMGRWYKAQPRLVSADFMHPLPAGAAQVGLLFETALVKSAHLAPTK